MAKEKFLKYIDQLSEMGFDCVPSSFLRYENPVGESSVDAGEKLLALEKEFSDCRRCPLASSRIKIVFGEGSPTAKLMFVGEGPGFDEDHTGRPFVGRAGKLLTEIIEKGIKIKRSDVYITNIVKCHPMKDPGNPEKRGNDRPPFPEEVAACMPILKKQIKIIKPEVICALGAPAAKYLLEKNIGITHIRGKVFEINPLPDEPEYSVKVVPTYHPAYLLRNPPAKKETWLDIQVVMKILGIVRK